MLARKFFVGRFESPMGEGWRSSAQDHNPYNASQSAVRDYGVLQMDREKGYCNGKIFTAIMVNTDEARVAKLVPYGKQKFL